MAQHHLKLLADAKAAADKLHGDTSVSQGTTLASLTDLRDHVGVLIEAVESTMDDE